MAATDAGTAATDLHRRELTSVRAATLRRVLSQWLLLDLDEIDRTAPEWVQATVPLVEAGRRDAVEAAIEYVARFSVAEIGLQVDASRPLPPDTRVLQARLLGSGPWTFKQKIGQGKPPSQAQAETLVRLAGEVTRTVLEGSRDTVTQTATEKGYRWQRITDGDPCAFCALLASRGAVYRSQSSGGFQAHRSCACTAEMVMRNSGFRTDESKQWGDLYDRSLREFRADPSDLNPDPLNVFRRAYEAQRS